MTFGQFPSGVPEDTDGVWKVGRDVGQRRGDLDSPVVHLDTVASGPGRSLLWLLEASAPVLQDREEQTASCLRGDGFHPSVRAALKDLSIAMKDVFGGLTFNRNGSFP